MHKFLRNWLLVFLVVFLWSYVWHNVFFSGFYHENLSQIARYVDGAVAPLMLYLALGNIMAALGFVLFLPKSGDVGAYLKNGFLMGLIVWGSFAVLSHAIFAGWTNPLMLADLSFGVTAGVLGGWVMKYLA